jgi:hypothetical protein
MKFTLDLIANNGSAWENKSHRSRGLSRLILQKLLSEHTGPLFSTTDNARMKSSLSQAGFVQRGMNGRAKGAYFRYGLKAES